MCKCECNECDCCKIRIKQDEQPPRPYLCRNCESYSYYRVADELAEFLEPKCKECGTARANFAGLTNAELDKIERNEKYGNRMASAMTVHLNEGHMWEERGMLNPHTLPLRGTKAYEHYKNEGRIKVDDQGRECMYSENKQVWAKQVKDVGMATMDGAGECDRSKQQGEHFRDG